MIELPTGAGKTYIALKAMERLNAPTLVVVPTLDLMDQWRNQLERLFKVEDVTSVMADYQALILKIIVETIPKTPSETIIFEG